MKANICCFAVASALTLGLTACGSTGTSSSASSTSSMTMPTSAASSAPSAPSAPAASASAPSATATVSSITIKDFMFELPARVSPGSQVSIKNLDAQAHTVTSKKGGFDVKVDPNGTATLTAPTTPGSYPVVCSFHANMSATLVVE
ncbi:cupredoxin domain-containing protein [Phycicoccus sp. M110.8]|uniref:cupredoxin domain-containing protein n=1 Tax=Phycicoccus sp. M110.8 TaxID=3075433 RepID=UPI0028FD7470|nr:cupredoxin domain-containing protein [Phycicoccus sp. M110.8]MDU0313367.1 cupredoxin domain-containing protein [Phycicoccus sp. M110.8]